jgi:hypothetical protein
MKMPIPSEGLEEINVVHSTRYVEASRRQVTPGAPCH